MRRVVDQRIVAARSAALDTIHRVLDRTVYAESRSTSVEERTRTVIGEGHEIGDIILRDIVQARACLQRVRSATQSAILQVQRIDVTVEEPDD